MKKIPLNQQICLACNALPEREWHTKTAFPQTGRAALTINDIEEFLKDSESDSSDSIS